MLCASELAMLYQRSFGLLLVVGVVLIDGCGSGHGTITENGSCSLGSCPIPKSPYVTVVGPSGIDGWDSVRTGGNIQLTATLRDTLGRALSGRTFQWRSADETKATVSEAGRLTALGLGSSQITATAMPDGIPGSINIAVLPGPIASLTVTPATTSIREGESGTLAAKAFDSYGPELPVSTVEWSSSNGSIASVSATGVVLGLTVGGPVVITAATMGKTASATVTVTPPMSIAFRQLSLGWKHTCGLAQDGLVYCWGSNSHGQLGDGTTVDHLTIAPVLQGELAFVELAAGADHTCARTREGATYCWGSNTRSELGDGSSVARSVPTAVAQAGTPVTALAAGSFHTCGLTSNGAAFCWGDNTFGELGIGTGDPMRSTPTRVVQGELIFRSLTANELHSCALTSAGRAYCWGSNASGEVGDGTRATRTTPNAVSQGDQVFIALASGANHACGLTGEGSAICWGELLRPNSPAVPFPSEIVIPALRLVALASPSGDAFQCALTASGQPGCWGWNGSGQLGNGGTVDVLGGYSLVPLPNERAIGIASGSVHTCVWTAAGKAFCWGLNDFGQLGDGTRATQPQPVAVKVPQSLWRLTTTFDGHVPKRSGRTGT